MKFKYIFILICSLFFIFNCTISNNGNNGSKNTNDEKPVQTPIITTYFTPDANGQLVFKTNDPAIIDPVYGSTIWIWGNILKPVMQENDVFDVTVSKESGKNGYGYGVIFCVQGDTEPNDSINDEGYNFLAVLIDNSGEYCVCKCTDVDKDGVLEESDIQGWTSCNDISKGQGVINDIQITYMGNNNGIVTFNLVFNKNFSIPPITFTYDTSQIPVFIMTARYGYIVTLAPDEYFPNTPVITKYNQKLPSDISLPNLSLMNKDLNFSLIGNNGIKIYKKNLFRKK